MVNRYNPLLAGTTRLRAIKHFLSLLCLAMALVFFSPRSPGELVLIRDGVAKAVVVTSDSPSPVAELAARELVEHVKLATGVALEVMTESEAGQSNADHRIFIGRTEAANSHRGLRTDFLNPDAFIISSFYDHDLFILGREHENGLRGGYNGTLYGVYELLERSLGVRWLWPGELGTYVPRRETIMLPGIHQTIEMKLPHRSYRIGHITRQVREYQPQIERLAFSPEGLDNYHRELTLFMRRHRLGNSTPMPWVPHQRMWQRHGDQHPEWFKMNDQGDRVGPTMCVSNPELHEFHTEPQSGCCMGLYDSRTGPAINLGEADRRTYCRCEDCMAWDEPQPEDWGNHITSNRYARYAAAVRDLGRRKNRGVDFMVTMFIYMDYFHAPTINIDLTGVHGAFCPWFSGFNPWYPMSDEAHQRLMNTWSGWRRTGMSMHYRPNYLLNGYIMPHLSTWQVGEMLRFTARHGSIGIDSDSLHAHWSAKGPMLYLEMRLAAKPHLEVAAVRKEFFSAFGPAAGKVEEYFDYWEDYSAQTSPQGGVSRARAWQADDLYPPESFEPAQALLAEAMEQTRRSSRSEYARRVEFLQLGLEHARLASHLISLLGSRGGAPSDREQFMAAREALRELIAFRREHEHLFISDYIAAAINENRALELDSLLD